MEVMHNRILQSCKREEERGKLHAPLLRALVRNVRSKERPMVQRCDL